MSNNIKGAEFDFVIFGDIKITKLDKDFYQMDILRFDYITQFQMYSYENPYANYNRIITDLCPNEIVKIFDGIFTPSTLVEINKVMYSFIISNSKYENKMLTLFCSTKEIFLENTDLKKDLPEGTFENIEVEVDGAFDFVKNIINKYV